MANKQNVFMSQKSMIITPLIQVSLLSITFLITFLISKKFNFSFFTNCVVFYFIMVFLTILFLRLLITIFPFQEGKFTVRTHPWLFYRWNLYSYFYITHLYFLFQNILIPPMFRKPFYQLLGARMGKGIIPINAVIADPALLEIEQNAIIGEDCLIAGHIISVPDKFMLGKVRIKEGALIGARSAIFPGVTIGENSMLKFGSVVYPNTTIPPNEIWGGDPAVKIKDIDLN